jgi:hypothetical protein
MEMKDKFRTLAFLFAGRVTIEGVHVRDLHFVHSTMYADTAPARAPSLFVYWEFEPTILGHHPFRLRVLDSADNDLWKEPGSDWSMTARNRNYNHGLFADLSGIRFPAFGAYRVQVDLHGEPVFGREYNVVSTADWNAKQLPSDRPL